MSMPTSVARRADVDQKRVAGLERLMADYDSGYRLGSPSKALMGRREAAIVREFTAMWGSLDGRTEEEISGEETRPAHVLQAVRAVGRLGLKRGLEATFIMVRGELGP